MGIEMIWGDDYRMRSAAAVQSQYFDVSSGADAVR